MGFLPKSNAARLTVFLLALLIAASAAFVLYKSLATREEELCAVISVRGEKVAALPLGAGRKGGETALAEAFGVDVVIESQGERIRFKSSDCPDKICVNTGWLSKDMDIAVCMPNEVAVVVTPLSQAGQLKPD